MSEIATLNKEGDVSIIKLDDGKANAFSYEMLSTFNKLLNQVPRDSGALVISGRDGLFSGGFDLKNISNWRYGKKLQRWFSWAIASF
jgi:enoyl-CoA hydratase